MISNLYEKGNLLEIYKFIVTEIDWHQRFMDQISEIIPFADT